MFDQSGKPVVLGESIGKGGEGEVFKIENLTGECAKIYFNLENKDKLEEKLNAMIVNPPKDYVKDKYGSPSIIWPKRLLYDNQDLKNLVGYTMDLLDKSKYKPIHMYYDSQDRLKNLNTPFTWKSLIYSARNISSTIASIHKKGHRIGDLSSNNILIAPNTLVAIIDCDSFQILKSKNSFYPCGVCTTEYCPRELLLNGKITESYDRYYSDLFALGVIIFQLLNNGFHPYSARGKSLEKINSREKKILHGYYPYGGYFPNVQPPEGAWPYEIIPPDIQKLFELCFVKGHSNPKLRPCASQWYNTLKGWTDD